MRLTMKKQSGGHGRFYFLLLLLMGMITARYSLQIGIPREVFLGIILLIAVLGDRDEIAAMCICCIPLHESVDFFYAIVFCMAAFVLKYPQQICLRLSVIPVLLMVLWELLHCFGEPFSIVGFVVDIVPLLALAIFMSTDASELDYDYIVRAVSVTTVLAGLSTLIKVMYLAGFDVATAFSQLKRLGVQAEKVAIEGGTINPNTLGTICVLAMTGLMQLRTAGRGNKKDMFLMVALLVLGALTSSRTFLACLALMILLLLFSQKGSFRKKMRFLGGMILVLALAVVFLSLVFPELLEYFISRFRGKDLTTGRLDLMGQYHAFIVSDPRVLGFGIGLHDFSVKVTQVYRVAGNVPHNGIQELVAAWGLPGLLLFGYLVLTMILHSGQGRRQRLLHHIPLILILFKAQAGQMLDSSYTMLAFSYAYLSLCADLTPGASPEEPGNR